MVFLMLEFLKVILLGIIEGITEWLPVSSTGHMILLEEVLRLNVSEAFWSMFLVVIQLGAILAVVVLFFPRLWPFHRTDAREIGVFRVLDREKITMWCKILISCVPAIVIGLPLGMLLVAGDQGGVRPLPAPLMKVINGLYKQDTGEVLIDGKPVEIKDPIQAREYGIAMIAQELNYIPEMSIEENVFLGRLPVKGFGRVDWKTVRSETLKFLAQAATGNRGVALFVQRTEMRLLPSGAFREAVKSGAGSKRSTTEALHDYYQHMLQVSENYVKDMQCRRDAIAGEHTEHLVVPDNSKDNKYFIV